MHDGAGTTTSPQGSFGIQARLDPLVAAQIFGLPLRELFNHCVAPDDVLGPAFTALERRLGSATDWGVRFELFERFVAERLARHPPPPQDAAWAVREVLRTRGRVAMGDLCDELSWSRKRLATAFRRYVGTTPKRYARVVRLEHALELLGAGHAAIDAALDAGYADQAHLCREVRSLSGVSVGTFLQDGLSSAA